MESLKIFPDVERAPIFEGLAKSRDELTECHDLRVGGLKAGTSGGKPSVIIAAKTPDGDCVVAETTLALFLSAADALKARLGDPRT
jgi:hypothetical protein